MSVHAASMTGDVIQGIQPVGEGGRRKISEGLLPVGCKMRFMHLCTFLIFLMIFDLKYSL